MKKSLTIIILMFTLLFAFATTAHAADSVANGTCGDNLTWTLTDDGVLTISGTGEMYDYSFSDPNWTPWISHKDSMTSVVVEAGITYIGEYAFYSCNQMESISIPGTVTAIGYRAFNGAFGLNDIYIHDPSAWCNITFDGQEANPVYQTAAVHVVDAEGNEITNVVLDSTVTAIPDYAFYECSLQTITIPSSVTSIGIHSFDSSALQSIVLPEGVTSIGDYAFYNCTSLQSVSIPKSVTAIGKQAFYQCGLTDVYITDPSAWCKVTFADSLASPAYYSDCLHIVDKDGNEVTDVVLDDTVTAISDYAFSNCSNLKSITLPDGLTSIGNYAFSNCNSLQSIAFPDSLTSIDNYAFNKCSSLTDVYITDPSAWCKISFGIASANPAYIADCLHIVDEEGNEITDVVLDETVTTISDYAFSNCSNLKNITLPDGLTSIGNYALSNCSSLQTITIPESVTAIGTYAFNKCDNLTDVYITDPSAWCKIAFSNDYANPAYVGDCLHIVDKDGNEVTDVVLDDTVTSIPDRAFYRCLNLKSISIPDSVTGIGYSAFYNCDSLQSVTIPGSVTTIGRYAFWYCDKLESVTLLNGVTVIGQDMFNECNNLQSISIPDSVTTIGEHAFYHCDNLQSITIPDSVTSIGIYAFAWCKALTTVVLEQGLTTIGANSFYECQSLQSITIPDSVTTIGANAFYDCKSLTSITIPDSVTSIGNGTFRYCSKLQSISIPKGVTSIGKQAFYYCSSLQSITIPDSVTSIGDEAFRYCSKLKQVYFDGNKPEISSTAFHGITATCYYYHDTDGWDSPIGNYGGTLTWTRYRIHRLSGKGRCETAILAADTLKNTLGVEKFDAIIIASGSNFADALAGSYLAAQKDAPILLYQKSAINLNKNYILENLSDDGVVYLLGGTAAVPETMEDALAGVTVKRLSGKTRFDTNLKILTEAGVTSGQEILVCTGHNFADSLSASATGLPILMVDSKKNVLTDGQKEFLETNSGSKITIIGGSGAVSDTLAAQLIHYGSVSRLSGKTRYETSTLIAEKYFDSVDTVVLAYAKNFPDGLCGGPVAHAMGAPMVLTAEKSETAAAAYVAANPVSTGYILGGTAALSDGTVNKIFQ